MRKSAPTWVIFKPREQQSTQLTPRFHGNLLKDPGTDVGSKTSRGHECCRLVLALEFDHFQRVRGIMQTEQVGASIMAGGLRSSVLDSPGENETIIDTTSYKRGLDYPCGCRHCRELKSPANRAASESTVRIDVYELPDSVEGESTNYFH
jgi:hypothetical protein